ARGRDPPPAGLPRHRGLGALDRGDGTPGRAHRRASQGGGSGEGEARVVTSESVRARKPPIPRWRWALWWITLGAADVVFYVLLTPIWIGLRAIAWAAEFRARRRR